MRDFWIKYVAVMHLFQNHHITPRYIKLVTALQTTLISKQLLRHSFLLILFQPLKKYTNYRDNIMPTFTVVVFTS